MRRILIEHARARVRTKRGGENVQVPLTGLNLATDQDPAEILALDDAIRRLREQDPRAAEIVELRFFGGLSVEETARTLDISERTVKREWALARALVVRPGCAAPEARAPEGDRAAHTMESRQAGVS